MKPVATALAVAVGIFIIIALFVGIDVFGLKVYGPWANNAQTEMIHNTNSYADTYTTKINGLVHEYDKLGEYKETDQIKQQKEDLVIEMCDAANKLNPAQVRDHVSDRAISLMREEGCYNA